MAKRVTKTELDRQIRDQQENPGSVYFPPFGTIHRSVSSASRSRGRAVEAASRRPVDPGRYLRPEADRGAETIYLKRQREARRGHHRETLIPCALPSWLDSSPRRPSSKSAPPATSWRSSAPIVPAQARRGELRRASARSTRRRSPSFNVNSAAPDLPLLRLPQGRRRLHVRQGIREHRFHRGRAARLAERAKIPLEFEKTRPAQQQSRHLKETPAANPRAARPTLANRPRQRRRRADRPRLSRPDAACPAEAVKLFRLGYAPDVVGRHGELGEKQRLRVSPSSNRPA